MNWFDAVLLILWAMGLLILIGMGRKLEAKMDALLTLFRALAGPVTVTSSPSIRGRDVPPPPEEKTVYHLTAEHDAKLLGEDAE